MVFTEHVKRSIKSGGKDEKEKKDVTSVTVCENVEKNVEATKNEREAPEGGWGWMVALGMVIAYIPSLTPSGSFTIIFGDFFESTGEVGYATTMVNALFNISFSIASVLTNKMMLTFSMRSVGIFGAVIFAIPNILYAFIDSIAEMAILSFIQGAGCGFIVTICHTNISLYFVTKRDLVVNVVQAITSTAGIFYVMWVERLMKAYGFRGTAAVVGAFSLNCIVGMSLMRPPETWGRKKKNAPKQPVEKGNECEKKKLFLTENVVNEETENSENKSVHTEVVTYEVVDKLNTPNGWNSLRSLKEETPIKNPLVSELKAGSISDIESGSLRQRSKSVLSGSWQESKKNAFLAGLSMSSTSLRVSPGSESISNAIAIRAQSKTMLEDEDDNDDVGEGQGKKAKRSFWNNLFEDLIDIPLLKDKFYLNSCVGISLVFTSDFTFASLVPLMLISLGYNKSLAAYTVTYSSAAELISRIALCLFTAFIKKVHPKLIFFFSMTVMFFAKISFMCFSYSETGILIHTVIIGSQRAWLMVAQPLIISYGVADEKLAPACGMFALISGTISLIFGPIGGMAKDWTGTYDACQIVLIVMNAIVIPFWAFELWYRRKERI